MCFEMNECPWMTMNYQEEHNQRHLGNVKKVYQILFEDRWRKINDISEIIFVCGIGPCIQS